ncbi:hypothetical protein OPV22_023803 [Ensete ventricosum]|uniref:Protein kinase domain-containing protein n=1 Tax=Ensete ventricosum TaxID=4639 RepID=A0AAV8PFN7_ENSVE|nr:hypothetical protein OPV22_023803 [Ensete ventricosum]
MVVAIKKLKLENFQGHKEWLCILFPQGLLNCYFFCSYVELTSGLRIHGKRQLGGATFHKTCSAVCLGNKNQSHNWSGEGSLILHDSEFQVIYRDAKASDILLDSEFNAKLSDLGLTKAGPTGDGTHVSTLVMGTQG